LSTVPYYNSIDTHFKENEYVIPVSEKNAEKCFYT